MSVGNVPLALLSAAIQLVAEYGAVLAKDVMDLIHGNPQQANETTEAYIVRINGIRDANLKATAENDAKVLAEDPSAPGS